jgi:Holliday junction resolvase RusA-like endonuclease
MPDLTITIPGKPIAKKRPRFARRGKFVTTYNCQETEEGRFALSVMAQLPEGFKPLLGALRLSCDFNMPIPTSATKRQKAEIDIGIRKHVKKPDASNMIKFIEDVLNGIVWNDDSQVVQLEARKLYSHQPSTVIEIVEL